MYQVIVHVGTDALTTGAGAVGVPAAPSGVSAETPCAGFHKPFPLRRIRPGSVPRMAGVYLMRAGSGQVPGLIIDWTRVPCLTWAAYCWPRRPNWSMAVATRWMLAWTTGPSG